MAKAKAKTAKKSSPMKKSAKPAKKAAPKAAAKSGKKSSGKPAKKIAAQKTVKAAKKTTMKAAPKKSATSKSSSASKGKGISLKTSAKSPAKAASGKGGSASAFADFMTPLDDRLVVRLTEAERQTAGGLFIPDTVADVSGNMEGHVLAVGRGHRNKKGHLRPMDVRPGDRVVFSEHAGSKLRWQNEDLVILREAEVMGVVP